MRGPLSPAGASLQRQASSLEICQALISTGLRDAGYVYISPGEIGYVRDPVTHTLELEFPEHFTGGDLKHLSSWLHTNGFKFSKRHFPRQLVMHGGGWCVRPACRG